jgi:hypothetical protein
MGFEQGSIKVEKEREFGDLRSAMEKAFAADRVAKYLKELDSRGIRIRDLDAAFAANAIDRTAGDKAGTARSLYGSAAGFGPGAGAGVLPLKDRGSRSGAAGKVSQAVSVLLNDHTLISEETQLWRNKSLNGRSRTAT